MITRSYFYQIDTMESAGKFGWGVTTLKSWLPNPKLAIANAVASFCEQTGRDKKLCKVISFNRV